jgi:predicted nucleic acid-binding protein
MNVMIDTNVIVDVLGKREPFVQDSAAVLMLAAKGNLSASITANTITDIYYLAKKHLQDHGAARNALLGIIDIHEIVDVTKADCIKAFDLPVNDYEDALLIQCARRIKADYIISRDVKDFINSPVKTITPKDFLSRFFPD